MYSCACDCYITILISSITLLTSSNPTPHSFEVLSMNSKNSRLLMAVEDLIRKAGRCTFNEIRNLPKLRLQRLFMGSVHILLANCQKTFSWSIIYIPRKFNTIFRGFLVYYYASFVIYLYSIFVPGFITLYSLYTFSLRYSRFFISCSFFSCFIILYSLYTCSLHYSRFLLDAHFSHVLLCFIPYILVVFAIQDFY